MSDSMVERVARAIEAEELDDLWARSTKHEIRRAMARAAIAAMRNEPTQAMLDAAYETWNNPISFADVWHAMIDAALEEKK